MEFLEACRRIIALDSTPMSGTRDLALFLRDLCQASGLATDLQEEALEGRAQCNLIARPVDEISPKEFLLQTHLDTCDPGAFGLWSRTGGNPFNATIYQNTMYGLGSADVKLDFLCKLTALESFKNVGWKRVPVLAGTYGEELGMAGAVRLIRKKKVSPSSALIGEPTDFALVQAGKGLARVEIEIPFSEEERNYRKEHDLVEATSTQTKLFVGKPAHSSNPEKGESAIRKMLEFVRKLPRGVALMEMEGGSNFNSVPANAFLEVDLSSSMRESLLDKMDLILRAVDEIERDFQTYADSEFDPPAPTMNIGHIRTMAENVVLSGCCRLPPTVSQEVYEKWMQHLSGVCQKVGAVFHVHDYKQPFRTPKDSALIKSCQSVLRDLDVEPKVMAQSVTNEANVFSRFGIECVVFGPGKKDGNVHTPEENVSIDDLHRAVEFYRRVIERECL